MDGSVPQLQNERPVIARKQILRTVTFAVAGPFIGYVVSYALAWHWLFPMAQPGQWVRPEVFFGLALYAWPLGVLPAVLCGASMPESGPVRISVWLLISSVAGLAFSVIGLMSLWTAIAVFVGSLVAALACRYLSGLFGLRDVVVTKEVAT